MEPPHEEQYTMEGNPSAYMSMRNYINQSWQSQPPVERNPRAYMSMRDYRNQWMGTPSYSVTPTYAPPPHPQYASWSQPQPPQPISPIEQTILDLTKLVGDAVVEQKEFNAQLSEKIHTEENSLDQRLDGLNNDFEHEWDNLQYSIEDLVVLQQCPPEEECQSGTMVEEPCLQQPQESLVENFESSVDAAVCLWEKKDAIPLLLTEEAVEEHKENNLPLPPTDSVYILSLLAPQSQPKTPTANAQATYNLLPVYILSAANSKPTAPAPKAHASPSLLVQNFMKLMAIAQTFVTTSKTQAVAYIAWHSGWFGCRFGFGAPEPRHF